MLISLILMCLLQKSRHRTWGDAISMSIGVTALYLYIVTELLSLGNCITIISVRLVWLLAIVVVLLLIIRNRSAVLAEIKNSVKKVKMIVIRKEIDKLFFGGFSIFMVVLAIIIVPYNWDSMTYHLTRIIMWAENRSVAHFATTVKRTVSSPTFGEMVNLHVYLLTGKSDQFFNLLQCLSYLLNTAFVYGITRKIGGTNGAGIFASVLFLTTPIAFAEALTTQVDQFSTLWLLIFTYQVLDLIRDKKCLLLNPNGYLKMAILALTAGFGYLTKPSVMVGMFGLTLWLIIECIRRKDDRRIILVWLVGTVTLALLVISPEIARNIVTYGGISDPWQGKGQLVHSIDPRYLLVGFMKNLFFNLPSTYWPSANAFFVKLVYWTAYKLHIDADAEAISEFGRRYVVTEAPNYGCDTAISPVPTSAMLLCIAIFIVCVIKHRKNIKSIGYTKVSFILFLLMCVLIRWEPWIGRYQLSYIALICPGIAFQIWNIPGYDHEKATWRGGWLAGMISLMCVTELLGSLHYTESILLTMREGDGRGQAYHYFNMDAYNSMYVPFIDYWNNKALPMSIGIHSEEDSYVYPILKYLVDNKTKIKFENVGNVTERYEDLYDRPDYILVIDGATGDTYECHGEMYLEVARFNDMTALYCKFADEL